MKSSIFSPSHCSDCGNDFPLSFVVKNKCTMCMRRETAVMEEMLAAEKKRKSAECSLPLLQPTVY